MGDRFPPQDYHTAVENIPANAAGSMSPDELLHLYETERDERIAAELRLNVALRESQSARQTAAMRDYVMASAHCLLWYADIYETDRDYLHWQMEFPNVEAALHFLPLKIKDTETLKDAWYNRRHPDDRNTCDEIGTSAVRDGRNYQQDFRCYCEDGSLRWLHEDVRVETVVAGKRWRAAGVCTDITSYHQLQEHMQATNKRLKRSVAETHHRVKNNLQVVASLVDMQHDAVGQPVEVQAMLQRIGQHIRALAAMHELLTFDAQSDPVTDSVSVRAVLEKLVMLVQETAVNRCIALHVESIRLPARQVTALVVLVNELLGNAVKHSQGQIELTVEIRNGLVQLEVCDSGPGFPSEFDSIRDAHTGLEIVESIGRWDLQGALTYETRPEGGGRVRLEFVAGAPFPA
jgi:two-component sensor histidine kinase